MNGDKFVPESNKPWFKVVPAEKGMGAKNCIIIQDIEIPKVIDIMGEARDNSAFVEDPYDGFGEGSYIVQFPGEAQCKLDDHDLSTKLNNLISQKAKP